MNNKDGGICHADSTWKGELSCMIAIDTSTMVLLQFIKTGRWRLQRDVQKFSGYPVQKYRTRINASLALQIFFLR